MTVLVLGGTSEARSLAALLVAARIPVVSSLAGAVRQPRLPQGELRVGGFGGVDGLASYLTQQLISAVVDATHPFAARISDNAVIACSRTCTPLLRLGRPGWSDRPDAHTWHWADDHDQAAAVAAHLGRRVLLTTGRQHLDAFVGPLAEHSVVARVVDEPDLQLPAFWRLLRDRGPYDVTRERTLLQDNNIDVLVTKDSGGSYTESKLEAAAQLGVAVVVVRRPTRPDSAAAHEVSTPEEAVTWLLAGSVDAGPSGPRT